MYVVTSNMFCAAANTAATNRYKDACNGDSGGPFAIKVYDQDYKSSVM